MAFPAYTYSDAVDLSITASNQLHTIINGSSTTEITIEDGSKIPSIRKAQADSMYFKEPENWTTGHSETDYLQLKKYIDPTTNKESWWFAKSATVLNPVAMGTSPFGDDTWTLYTPEDLFISGKAEYESIYQALKGKASEAGYNLVRGSFEEGGTLTGTSDVLWYQANGKYYNWFNGSAKTVVAGSTPATSGGVGAGAWVDRTDVTLRDEIREKLVYGPNEIIMGVSGSNSLVRNKTKDRPTRIHQEPHGNLFSGVTYKYDWMFDPYQDDNANYRIFNVYGYIGDPNNTGEGAVAVIGAKSAGNTWGSWPSMHFGFNDDSSGGCAMKVMQFDTSDTVFRTPNKGPWKSGMSVAIGDHVTSSNKIYVAATSGITGTTKPAHGSGTVSDGSVDWTLARIPSAAWVKPCVVIGDRDKMPLFGWGDVRLQLLDDVLLAGGRRISLLDVDNKNTVYLFSPAAGLFDIRMAGGGLIRFDNNNKSIGMSSCRHMLNPSVATGISTPDVSSTELVRVSNTVPTDITWFTGTKPNQIFYVESTTANMTTIKASSTLLTKTGADIVMSQFQVLLFKVSHDGIRIVQV